MTGPCDIHCPFLGCASCEYAGGGIPSAGTVFTSEHETMGVRKTTPGECANTAEGLTLPTGLESKWL